MALTHWSNGLLLADLKKLWGEPNCNPSDINISLGPVCTDSRFLNPGDFFIPLTGDNFDGHIFLSEAAARGAQGAVINAQMTYLAPDNLCHWSVSNTLVAYQELACLHRRQLRCPIIAITGSVGKTTTRELIKALIDPLGTIISSNGNDNNEIGVPMTLLRGSSEHAALVVEMGMRRSGEIMQLSRCACPNIAVITNIGTAHIGYLGSKFAIAKAKCEITAALQPGGLLIIPAGDALLEEALKPAWHGRVLRVALEDEAENISSSSLPAPDLTGCISADQQQLKVGRQWYALPLKGLHNARNLMLALAVAQELQVSIVDIKSLKISLPPGRNHILRLGPITILDETYNASPESMLAALNLLKSCDGRHFAVLGTMLELGNYSVALHQYVAEQAVALGLDGLVLVVRKAEEAKAMIRVTSTLQRFAWVKRPEAAVFPITSWLAPGDTLLLKASRGVGLEKLLSLLGKQLIEPRSTL